MRFAAPAYLWLLLLSPALALGGVWAHRRRVRALQRFAGGGGLLGAFSRDVSVHRRTLKLLLVHVGLVALALALARPQWGTRLETVTRRGADVVIALDTSLSMAADDLAPSRLSRARHTIGALLDELAGDRVALVAFAGEGTLVCPLTIDHGAVRLFLEAQDVRAVTRAGTSLARGLAASLDALAATKDSGERGRAVVLFSDGEDHEGELDATIEQLARAGVNVYVVGCGTARGAPIPLRDAAGGLTEYKKDREGKLVTTRLDETVLERIALETDGRYWRATPNELEVEEIAQALSGLDAGELGTVLRTRYEERFQVPLAVAWLALAAECLLGDRRRRQRSAAEAARADAA